MKSSWKPYVLNITALILSIVLSVSIGAVFIPPGTIARIVADALPGVQLAQSWSKPFEQIIIQVRLPHTALILMSGAALSGSGAAYQGLFRNPLAEPYLLGVASGAGLGAILAMGASWPDNWLGFFKVPLMAFAGGLLTILLVYQLARVGKTLPTATLILAGVATGSFANALTSYLMLRSDQELRRAIGWLLGGSPIAGWEPVLAALPFIMVGLLTLMAFGHSLNVLQFGEEQAIQLGLPVERVKQVILIAASLTAASAVAFAGIIGFVGLIVPHLVRFVWGSDYRHLIPLSILGGASLLLLADVVARTLAAPQTLPIGIVTALLGVPFFLWVLRVAKWQPFW